MQHIFYSQTFLANLVISYRQPLPEKERTFVSQSITNLGCINGTEQIFQVHLQNRFIRISPDWLEQVIVIHTKCSQIHFLLYYLTILTLTLPGPSAGVSGSLDSYCSLKPLCSGMGEVVPARTSLTLLPPSPRTVLSLSCFKVSQCINCRDWHSKS